MSAETVSVVDEQKISDCIARLWDDSGQKGDFRDFVEAMRRWSRQADEEGLEGTGEQGTLARGVARAYRGILKRIEESVHPAQSFRQEAQEPVG